MRSDDGRIKEEVCEVDVQDAVFVEEAKPDVLTDNDFPERVSRERERNELAGALGLVPFGNRKRRLNVDALAALVDDEVNLVRAAHGVPACALRVRVNDADVNGEPASAVFSSSSGFRHLSQVLSSSSITRMSSGWTLPSLTSQFLKRTLSFLSNSENRGATMATQRTLQFGLAMPELQGFQEYGILSSSLKQKSGSCKFLVEGSSYVVFLLRKSRKGAEETE